MPRAGSGGGGGFATDGGFSDPWGGAGSGGGGVYTPPKEEQSNQPPGRFGFDLSSPEGFVAKMEQNKVENQNLFDGLGAALFGKNNGSLLGGIPGVSDLGDASLKLAAGATQLVWDAPGHIADAVGGALEHVPLGGQAQLQSTFDALPDSEIKREAQARIEADPSINLHIMSDAIGNWQKDQNRNAAKGEVELLPAIGRQAGSLADVMSILMEGIGSTSKLAERGFAGLERLSGTDRLEEIELRAQGATSTGLFAGQEGLTAVEEIAYQKWKDGSWTREDALNFLAASGAGFSHDEGLNLLGSFAADPQVWGSLGASGIAKAGITGARLLQTERAIGDGAKLVAGGGRLARTEAGGDFLRMMGKVYEPLQGSSLGTSARVVRTIIDPLYAIGQKKTTAGALLDVASEAAPRAVVGAYGEGNHLRVLSYARQVGGSLYDDITNGIGVFAANLTRKVLATEHQQAMLLNGLGDTLTGSVPGDIIDDLAAKAPKHLGQRIMDLAVSVQVKFWDDAAKQNLADRMASQWGMKSAEDYLTDIKGWDDDTLGLIHAASYGTATKNFLIAQGEAVAEYTGKMPMDRMILLNRDTLTNLGAEGILGDIDKAADSSAAEAIIRAAQDRYPELRYISIDAQNLNRSIDRFQTWLDQRLERGVLPHQITDAEKLELPESLKRFDDQSKGAWTIGFRPEDDLLWGLEHDLEGGWRAAASPWVDHVADGTPAFRAGRLLKHNVAGMPILGPALRVASGPVDYMEAAARTMKRAVSSASITENARGRFVAQGQKLGATETEARVVFQAVMEAAQLNKSAARGLSESNMWDKTKALLPARLVDQGILTQRSLMNLVLEAYEGDLRFVGLTQKLTGRAKTALGPAGGNFMGQIAEDLYPRVKFRLNPIFQAQERLEAIILNSQRGVTAILGTDLNEADRIAENVIQRMAETGVVRIGDNDMQELSKLALIGDDVERGMGKLAPKGRWAQLVDVQGSKRANLLRTFEKDLGRTIAGPIKTHKPGLWEDLIAEYSKQAGRLLSDDEVAIRYLSEQLLGNEVTVNGVQKAGMRGADFDSAITTAEWSKTTALGEIKPLSLDFLAKRAAFPLRAGKDTASAADLRAGLASGELEMERIKDFLTHNGASSDYIRRVENALNFSWDGFWSNATKRFGLSPTELRQMQRMMQGAAKVRGVTPVDFMSQVISPMVQSGEGALIESLASGVSILRAPAKEVGTAADLTGQLADIFMHHLDPSAQEDLFRAFEADLPGQIDDLMRAGKADESRALQATLERIRGGDGTGMKPTGETNRWFADRILHYMDGTPPASVFEEVADATRGVEEVRTVAEDYMKAKGIHVPPRRLMSLDDDFSQRTAKAYDDLPSMPPVTPRKTPVTPKSMGSAKRTLKPAAKTLDAETRAAYQAFVDETMEQYAAIRAAGITIVPVKTNPYATSADMVADVRDNKTLKVYAVEADHPVMTNEQNVIFRGVHDYFAHAAEGFQFGARGELNAAVKHSQMYGPEARRAMLSETHGQNSFVNYSDKPAYPAAPAAPVTGPTVVTKQPRVTVASLRTELGDAEVERLARDYPDRFTQASTGSKDGAITKGAVKFPDGTRGDYYQAPDVATTLPEPWRDKAVNAYADKTELVSVDVLKPFREHNREVAPKYGGTAALDELEADIRVNGFREPVILSYDPENGLALLGEGNHRLAVALRMEEPAIPVRVVRTNLSSNPKAVPWDFDPKVVPNEHGYVPGDMSPSDIGMPVDEGFTMGRRHGPWGESHGYSKMMTASAARTMGIPGYPDTVGMLSGVPDAMAKGATDYIQGIYDSPGGRVKLYSGQRPGESRVVPKVGETLDIPLKATTQNAEGARGFSYGRGERERGFVYEFPEGTRGVYHAYDEVVVGGRFVVESVDEVPADTYLGIPSRHLDADPVMVVRLRQAEVFNPTTKAWESVTPDTRTVAEVNRAAPGTIYAEQKAALLPQDILDEFEEKFIGRTPGLESNPDVARAIRQFGKWSKDALADGLLSGGTPNPYSDLLSRVANIPTEGATPFNRTQQLTVNAVTDAMRMKEQDAFRLQYFSRNRTFFERSLNHPMFGLYPASYMWGKIMPELVRFIAKSPFGIETGALAYTMRDVQKAIAIQREYDPEFDKLIEDLGHDQTLWFLGYMLPALPMDVGASAPTWMRNLADQGLDNQARIDRGEQPRDVSLIGALGKQAEVLNPFRPVKLGAGFLEDVGDKVRGPEEPVVSSDAPTAPLSNEPVTGLGLGPTLSEQMDELQTILRGS